MTPELSPELVIIVKAIVAIADILERDPERYNKTDIRIILIGKKKNYTPKYDFAISSGRVSAILDVLDLFGIFKRNEKNLFSLRNGAKEKLIRFGIVEKEEEGESV